ncbi:MAG: hypothetical protein Aurels2KO_56170 [Aureliella sp.]
MLTYSTQTNQFEGIGTLQVRLVREINLLFMHFMSFELWVAGLRKTENPDAKSVDVLWTGKHDLNNGLLGPDLISKTDYETDFEADTLMVAAGKATIDASGDIINEILASISNLDTQWAREFVQESKVRTYEFIAAWHEARFELSEAAPHQRWERTQEILTELQQLLTWISLAHHKIELEVDLQEQTAVSKILMLVNDFYPRQQREILRKVEEQIDFHDDTKKPSERIAKHRLRAFWKDQYGEISDSTFRRRLLSNDETEPCPENNRDILVTKDLEERVEMFESKSTPKGVKKP